MSVYCPQAEGESSALRDGSLVDLCGATLLWRTGEGLMRAPTLRHLEALRQELNASRPQCPVGLSTLAFPSLPRSHRWARLLTASLLSIFTFSTHGYTVSIQQGLISRFLCHVRSIVL